MRVTAIAIVAVLTGVAFTGWSWHSREPGETIAVERLQFRYEEVHANLSFPTSIAFAPDGRLFFNERFTGNVRVVHPNGSLQEEPFARVDVHAVGEGGLLGLALHPDFQDEPWVYVSYTVDSVISLNVEVARFRADGRVAGESETVVRRLPANHQHAGGILEFGPDGMLYLSGGDAGVKIAAPLACLPHGKIHRFTPEGGRPADNPFDCSSAFSVGHRNVFGLAFDPVTGALYATENGPTHSDEVNRITAGAHYGWPVATGVFGGSPTFHKPLLVYTPPVAPTEATFYTGHAYGRAYRHDLFFGSWVAASLHRVVLDPDTGEALVDEVVAKGEAVLDVENGPDGHLYVATPTSIARVVPLTT